MLQHILVLLKPVNNFFYNTLNFAYQGISFWLTTTVPLLSSLYKICSDVMLLTLFLSSSLSLILSCSWYLILCLSCSVSTISFRNLSRSFSLTTEKRMKIWWRHNEVLLHYRIMTSQCKWNLPRKIEKLCIDLPSVKVHSSHWSGSNLLGFSDSRIVRSVL